LNRHTGAICAAIWSEKIVRAPVHAPAKESFGLNGYSDLRPSPFDGVADLPDNWFHEALETR
jgi:hypothetical protein